MFCFKKIYSTVVYFGAIEDGIRFFLKGYINEEKVIIISSILP